ncbi:hypothetical protein OC846_004463 [Tilletia horrida]|uniref:Uncharacterized protein n=1 Tax=Tilletia horrida TaxID=155126 RepID=A0AAN6GQF1_9BASI|nr:hypothetical protein OC846_004463 [Tilletia horrida]KAK0561329.1 hypothetical protein OC861_005874 [Tilletia horrida]
MQFRYSVLALALAAGAVGASQVATPESNAIAQRDASVLTNMNAVPLARAVNGKIHSKLSSIAGHAASQIRADAKRFKALNGQKTVSKPAAKAAVNAFASHLTTVGTQLSHLAAESKSAAHSRDLIERRDLLETIISDLVSGLDAVVPEVIDLLKTLLNNLGLGGISDLVDALTPALDSVKTAIETLLTNVGNALGPILDPILEPITTLLNSLLGGGAPAPAKRAVALSPATAASINKIQTIRAGLAADRLQTHKLKLQKNVSLGEAKALVGSITSHARAAKSALDAIQQNAATSRDLAARATPDLATAVAGLISDLNNLLPGVESLLTDLTTNLGLDAVTQLIQELEPVLQSLLTAVENVVQKLANALSPIVDPLLAILANLLNGLGNILG